MSGSSGRLSGKVLATLAHLSESPHFSPRRFAMPLIITVARPTYIHRYIIFNKLLYSPPLNMHLQAIHTYIHTYIHNA